MLWYAMPSGCEVLSVTLSDVQVRHGAFFQRAGQIAATEVRGVRCDAMRCATLRWIIEGDEGVGGEEASSTL